MENTQKPKPPTFRFKNIGPVKDAEVELGDFTIIAGRNNTGKTYLVYTLYSFLEAWKDGFDLKAILEHTMDDSFEIPDLYSIADDLRRDGCASFPLEKREFSQHQEKFIQALARKFSQRDFPIVFSTKLSEFEQSSIEAKFNEDFTNASHNVKGRFSGGVSLSMKYDGNNIIVNADSERNLERNPNLDIYTGHLYVALLFCHQLPEPFILSAERFGISLFYKELDFTKNQLVDLLQKMGDTKSREAISPFRLIDKATSRYALPIKNNIDYTRDIAFLQERKSEIFENKLFDDIKDMMDGYYVSSDDGIRFISKARGKGRSFNIPLHLASSSVRGLSDFYFFLKHVANKNHLLIVDEPESHLDTSNQILLARLLARCVRAGLKVLITTHSDYLIKEINNLVMLSRPFEDKEAVVKKLKYSADDFIDPDSIRAYVAEDNSLTRCDVDRFGIDMPVFDETIDRINRVANDLASRMSEDSEA